MGANKQVSPQLSPLPNARPRQPCAHTPGEVQGHRHRPERPDLRAGGQLRQLRRLRPLRRPRKSVFFSFPCPFPLCLCDLCLSVCLLLGASSWCLCVSLRSFGCRSSSLQRTQRHYGGDSPIPSTHTTLLFCLQALRQSSFIPSSTHLRHLCLFFIHVCRHWTTRWTWPCGWRSPSPSRRSSPSPRHVFPICSSLRWWHGG